MERQSSRVMNVDEMEMSEDYTCVIAHGPNPRKTHIFDNCVVEKCGVAFWGMPRDEGGSNGGNFLSFCHSCKRSLGEGKDIFMYRSVLKSQLSLIMRNKIHLINFGLVCISVDM
jgi:zinc-finger of the FCS-type, C2-C2